MAWGSEGRGVSRMDAEFLFRAGGYLAVASIFPVTWLLWNLITPQAEIVRSQVVSANPSGCRAEVWVEGKTGDRLARLLDYPKRQPPRFVSAIISHENCTSTRLPSHVRTPSGHCEITRWHLLVGGAEADSVGRRY
jgi:hypothetical protein